MVPQMVLLDQCSDLVLRCSDGRDIPCIKYYCMSTCDVIRYVCEDVDLEHDDRGRAVVPFPNVDSSDLALAVELMHGVRSIASLDADTTSAVVRGMRALGHASILPQLMSHLWKHVGESWAGTMLHLGDLLHTETLRLDVLRKLVLTFPTWPEFSAKVFAPDVVAIDAALATFLVRTLSQFFPAGPLFVRVMDLLPTSVLTAEAAIRVFTESRAHAHFHPAEAVDVMEALARAFERGGWDALTLELLRGILVAHRVYDVVPQAAANMHGSIVMLESTPMTSMLLTVSEPKGPASRKMAPWATVYVDWCTGHVDARLTMCRMDEDGKMVRRCQVRFSAFTRGSCAELWYDVRDVNPFMTFSVVTSGEYAAGNVDAFRNVIRSPLVTRLRIDVFYGGFDVLQKCFF